MAAVRGRAKSIGMGDGFNEPRLLEPFGCRRSKPRSTTTTSRWINQPWQRDPIQTASDKPGAVQLRPFFLL